MKKALILVCMSIFFLTGCTKEENINNAQERNGLVYLVNSDKSFSGTLIAKYSDGQLEFQGEYEAGLKDGESKWYYSNGQLKTEATFEAGYRNGEWTEYYENSSSKDGQIEEKLHYKEGIKDGEYVAYYNNGTIDAEGLLKNNVKDGKWTWYWNDGKDM